MVRYRLGRRQPGDRVNILAPQPDQSGTRGVGKRCITWYPPGGIPELLARAASDRSSMDTHEHHQMTDHEHAGHGDGHGATTWSMAAQATLHCLTGCAIGEVLGMIIGTAAGFHNAGTIVLSIVLAFIFGYALTMRGVFKSGLTLGAAFKVALAADTVSIAIMELIDNTVIVAIPGAMDAGLGNWLFWASLAFSLAVAFVVTTPVNRWMIGRGLGHAVVHGHH
jgi:hypothetical protein